MSILLVATLITLLQCYAYCQIIIQKHCRTATLIIITREIFSRDNYAT